MASTCCDDLRMTLRVGVVQPTFRGFAAVVVRPYQTRGQGMTFNFCPFCGVEIRKPEERGTAILDP